MQIPGPPHAKTGATPCKDWGHPVQIRFAKQIGPPRAKKVTMPHHPHSFEHRPPWWPENEPWPPVKGRLRRNPFFRRLGCAFAFLNVFGLVLFVGAIVWLAGLFGQIRLPSAWQSWLLPVGVGLLIFVAILLVAGVFGLRRVFNPLDDLLEAATRVAQGDYAVRVPERGSAEVRSLSRAFNNMASRLDLADEKRRNLLADVTHELRTPLTVLQGNLEGMLDGIYPADETNLRSLLNETDILARLIEDLRLVALAESGALQLKKEPTDLVMLVRDTVNAFQPQAEAAGVKIMLVTPASTPQLLELDPGRIRQVLLNLMSNALRYSPSAGKIGVTCLMQAGIVVIEISDEGPGIPSGDLPHIFERYYKSADSSGMGLGLAIARHLVVAHGGKIEATSAEGRGTIIRISFFQETNQ